MKNNGIYINMKRRDFIKGTMAASLLSCLPRSGLFAEPSVATLRPNVLFLFSDQHHAGMIGCSGRSDIQTPALDRLAASGTRFNRAYCQDGVCCPSRSSMISGQYPRTLGNFLNAADQSNLSIVSRLTPMQRAFSKAGYYTFTTGKRHVEGKLNTDWDYSAGAGSPNDGGYRSDTLPYAQWINQKGLSAEFQKDWAAEIDPTGAAPSLTCRPSALPPEATMEAFAAQQTIEFLKSAQSKKQPFFAWSTFYRPHQPYTPQKKYIDKIDFESIRLPDTVAQNPDTLPPGLREFRLRKKRPWDFGNATEETYRLFIGYYMALLHEIDDHIHAIRTTLEEEGLSNNTIIIYSSDHGDFAGNHGLVEKGAWWHNFYEDTLRVPLIMSWPGKISSGVVRQDLTELVDIYPTLLSLCGIAAPTDYPLAGKDLSPTLMRQEPVGRKYVISENWSQATVIADRYKYGQWLNCVYPQWNYQSWGNMLMDRETDPNEISNLIKSGEHESIRKELELALNDWVKRTADDGRREFYAKQKISYSQV